MTPVLRRAHVWAPPALIDVNLPGTGVICPNVLEPQQSAVPSVRRPHVCSAPASTEPTMAPGWPLPGDMPAATGNDPAVVGAGSTTLPSNRRTTDTTTALQLRA